MRIGRSSAGGVGFAGFNLIAALGPREFKNHDILDCLFYCNRLGRLSASAQADATAACPRVSMPSIACGATQGAGGFAVAFDA